MNPRPASRPPLTSSTSHAAPHPEPVEGRTLSLHPEPMGEPYPEPRTLSLHPEPVEGLSKGVEGEPVEPVGWDRLIALSTRLRPLLRRAAGHAANAIDDEDDILHDIVLKWIERDLLDRPDAYLIICAQNVVRDSIRRWQVRVTLDPVLIDDDGLDFDLLDLLADDGPEGLDPEEIVIQRETARQILESLSYPERVIAQSLPHQSAKDIAARFGFSEPWVSQKLKNIRQQARYACA